MSDFNFRLALADSFVEPLRQNIGAISLVHAVLSHWCVLVEETNFAGAILGVHDSAVTLLEAVFEATLLNLINLKVLCLEVDHLASSALRLTDIDHVWH